MKKLYIIILGTLLFWACSTPEGRSIILEKGSPYEVGLSLEKLKYIDSLFLDYLDKDKLPGAVALVIKDGKIIKHSAYGEKADGVTQEVDDIFRIASMTKAITAVAALSLLEKGKFGLDDPVWWYIPEFRYPKVLDEVNLTDSSYTSHPANDEIKIRQLFNHTSGIGYGFQDDRLNAVYWKNGISEGFEERDISLEKNISVLGGLPLMHDPGEKWTYGLSYDVLGRIIEVVSGKSLDEYMQETIFDPLGMQDTYFYLPENKFHRLSDVYMSSNEGVVPTDYDLIDYPIKGAKKYLSGGADISTTAMDYAKFAQMVMNKGQYNGARILGPKTIEWITEGQVNGGLNAIGWGFGVHETKDDVLNYISPGSCQWGGFFSTHCLMDPKEEIIAILMLQMYPNWEWDAHTRFENIVYASILD